MTAREWVKRIEDWIRAHVPQGLKDWYYALPQLARILISGLVFHGGLTFCVVFAAVLLAGGRSSNLSPFVGVTVYSLALVFWLWHEEGLEDGTLDSLVDFLGPLFFGVVPVIWAVIP